MGAKARKKSSQKGKTAATKAQKTLSTVIQYFDKNYSLGLSGSNNIKLNSRTLNPKQFVDKFNKEKMHILDFAGSDYFDTLSALEKKKKMTREEATEYMADKVFSAIRFRLLKERKEKHVKNLDPEISKHTFNWANHIPIIDITTKQPVMYDTNLKCVDHRTSYAAWKEHVNTLPTEAKRACLDTTVWGVVNYDPYKTEEIQYKNISGQEEIVHINAHRTPDWRKKEIGSGTKELPEMFEALMNHLFPQEDCRDYVYHWLNFMMTSRNHCFLLLHGEQGIGKNTLASVAEKLVGFENYSYVNPSFWDDDKFNSELKYKRCVFFDETVVTPQNLASIRSITNKYIAITEKGIDTINYENFCSFIIANNLDKVNHITYDDRRYSVPVMTRTPIKNVLGVDWLDEFYEIIENDEFIGQIGHWILNYGDKGNYNEKQPYLSDYFYDIVDKGLHAWQVAIINMIESYQYSEIDISDKDYKEQVNSNVGRVKVEGFLETHKDRDGENYGRLVQRGKQRVIEVNKKYWPEHALEWEQIKEENGDTMEHIEKEDYHSIDF